MNINKHYFKNVFQLSMANSPSFTSGDSPINDMALREKALRDHALFHALQKKTRRPTSAFEGVGIQTTQEGFRVRLGRVEERFQIWELPAEYRDTDFRFTVETQRGQVGAVAGQILFLYARSLDTIEQSDVL